MLVHLVSHLGDWLTQGQPPPGDGGPDFSNIQPNSRGVPKAGIFVVIAQVLMYAGLGVLFIVFAAGLIMWGGGSMFKNTGWTEDAKSKIFKAAGSGVLVTAAGAVWTWIIGL